MHVNEHKQRRLGLISTIGLLLLVMVGCKREPLSSAGEGVAIDVQHCEALTVRGIASCPTGVGCAKVEVLFSDANKALLRSKALSYGQEYGIGWFDVKADRIPVRFKKTIAVPMGAVKAEVRFVAGGCHNSIIVRDLGAKPSQLPSPKKPWLRMSMISVSFLAFVFLVVTLYYLLPFVVRPWLLLFVSAVFYACFGWFAMGFVVLSAIGCWMNGMIIASSANKNVARISLFASVSLNIGLLIALKYMDPVITPLLSSVGLILDSSSWILPLGISFYTLQAVSYCVDVYRGEQVVERNPFRLMLYLLFFPTIMQGPISRYGQLGGQLWTPHRFDLSHVVQGSQLLLWGYFLKTVIADRAALAVGPVFSAGSPLAGWPVVIGCLCYSIQIYTDFMGCVCICRGVAEMLGIELVENFSQPYFATSVADFWHRWHISLSTWLRDYVYIPLGGNRHGSGRKYLNIIVVFAVSGLWHGVGATFFIWGLLHGSYQVLSGWTKGIRRWVCQKLRIDSHVSVLLSLQRIWTFALVSFAWIFFRAESIGEACSVVRRLFFPEALLSMNGEVFRQGLDGIDATVLAVALAILIVVSVAHEHQGRVRTWLSHRILPLRWALAIGGVIAVLVLGVYGPGYNAGQFIYMQF